MKAIQFTGLRLGATYEGWPEDGARIRQRQRDLLTELYSVASESGTSLLISAGDLFDGPAVPLEEVEHVVELCRRHPKITLAALPGDRDPWGTYTVYHHLKAAGVDNLLVLSPGLERPREVLQGVWLYSIPSDSSIESSARLEDLIRQQDDGIHIAVAYGPVGRLREGPEAGLVMVSPSVAAHPFDWLALADGTPAERIGSATKPATYAGPLISDQPGPRDPAAVWSIQFGSGAPALEAVRIQGIRQVEMDVDLGMYRDTAAVAAEVRRESDTAALMCVTLSGVRPADRPIIGPSLRARCAKEFLGIKVVDRSVTGPPSPDHASSALITALWQNYQAASEEDRQAWADALMLCASGVTDPQVWREAPWARW